MTADSIDDEDDVIAYWVSLCRQGDISQRGITDLNEAKLMAVIANDEVLEANVDQELEYQERHKDKRNIIA